MKIDVEVEGFENTEELGENALGKKGIDKKHDFWVGALINIKENLFSLEASNIDLHS